MGGDNFVANVVWQRSYSPINLKKHFSNNHDYILTYAKNIEKLHDFTLERTSEMNARYKNLDNDERGVWKSSDLSVGPAVERNIYPIFNPYTKQEIYPPHGYSWRFSQEKLQELIADNRIFFPQAVLDFFAVSDTTCAVVHKLKRKYIGIEMGEHFDSVILPRLKKVIGGFKSGAAKEFNKGGVVKVYALESYEEILKALKEALIW
ncbi:hypothetical protein TH0793_14860 [Helicobacter pylori]